MWGISPSALKLLFFLSVIINFSLIFDQTLISENTSSTKEKILSSLPKMPKLPTFFSTKQFPCDDKFLHTSYSPRGDRHFVLHNYFIADKSFHCDESVTYTTHGEWTYLDKLISLLRRWNGPVSFSIYCPGEDFEKALKKIQFLRECSEDTMIKDFVTFHMIFDHDHPPKIRIPSNPQQMTVNCEGLVVPPSNETERQKNKKMTYPINVLRNVARENSQTRFLFASDVELFPSPNLIPRFLRMVVRENYVENETKKVFVLPIFEVEANITDLPNTKLELVQLLDSGMAIPFHKYICPSCHTQPKSLEWKSVPPADMVAEEMHVFHVGKRKDKFKDWEPIFIGTNDEPWYDERLSWEGRSDKMTQGFALCLLDYEFHILDNAFLIHSPGIKRKGSSSSATGGQRKLIQKTILPELELLYGNGSKDHGCAG